jgi:ketosteroid isomerase-like protein
VQPFELVGGQPLSDVRAFQRVLLLRELLNALHNVGVVHARSFRFGSISRALVAGSSARRTGDPMTRLPPAVSAYFAAADADENDALLGCFADDAVVADEDKEWHGPGEIQRWRETVATKYEYTVEVRDVDEQNDMAGDALVDVHTHLEGNFPGGTVDLDYRFTLRGGTIRRLEIVPTSRV